MLPLALSLAAAVGTANALSANGYVNLAAYGGIPNAKAAGILYGMPNDPAYYPNKAPTRDVWGSSFQQAGFAWQRAGGAQTPYYGYSAGINNGNFTGYEGRFASALQNYQDLRALNPNGQFVLLPHDIWGADGVSQNTQIYPCDNGDCTDFDNFLNRLISDLKSNNMLTGLHIDIWNEPNGSNFWPRNQTQYFQMWDYAWNKFRSAFNTDVPLVGPSTSDPPGVDADWWAAWGKHLQSSPTIPDWWNFHQLLGRYAANCGNDPVDSYNELNSFLQQYNLPSRPVQTNEYAGANEQTPAYSAWFIERFERVGTTGLRANWGSGIGLHNDFAKTSGPGGNSNGEPFYKLGDWHVYNYYTQVQKGYITEAGADGSTCYDLYVTQERDNGLVHILAGTRGQTGSYPITVSNVNSMPAFNGLSTLRAVIQEIPYNNGNEVDNPTVISDGSVSVSNNQVMFNLDMNLDSAYTIDISVS